MTGFDETVPPDDTEPQHDGTSVAPNGPDNDLDEQGPEHDTKNPAREGTPTGD